ncbi:Sec-independent protein translocase protein TatB [Novosphingobium sp. G106]|uniref:Sec-independent protein translocase protein TatB n=1 Tax=Novosphingobium sp. G106 TaxID=2849500 RepID=UPI001C2CD178|nr:Sec-independent protein translocase protein TatB [Novosphingobium sp. G106]MBV1689161.1 Sec-independent protein translocase protein TatB [Novosphingobium sp. G106]
MFDIGADEFLLIAVVAIVVIGPKDLPRALRVAGQWIAKVRRVSGHFRSGIETMIREAELAEMEEKWRKQNEAIMQAHPEMPEMAADPALPSPAPVHDAAVHDPFDPPAEPKKQEQADPQLPLPPP